MKKSILQLVKTGLPVPHLPLVWQAGIISSFLFAMVIRCLAQPAADFTYAFTNGGCAPDSVVFTNTSTGANAYFWDFGDFGPNDTSTAVNPYHIYLWDGTFTVTLTAYDTLTGNSDQTIQILTINFTPWSGWAWFWVNPNPVCPGDPMDFSTFMFPPPTSMLWDFDDGDSSTLFSPSHIYADTGIYNVTLIAGNSCGSDTVTSPVSVYDTAAIFAGFSASPATACPGQPVEFSNFSSPTPASSLWLFGDGDSATTFNAIHYYTDTGSYTVTLIVYSSCNSDTATTTVTIDTSLIPSVSASASPNPVCPNDVVSFSGFGNNLTSFLWNFGDGGNSLQEDPAHSFTDTGTYTVVFTATNYCGNSNSATVIVVVGDSVPPVWVSFWTNPWSFCSTFSNICPGTIVRFINNSNYATSFYWDFGDGNTSTLEEPTHVFANTGTYDVKLIGTSSCGGVDSIVNCVYVVNDAAPSAWFCTNPFCFPTTVVCLGSPVFFENWSSDTTNSLWDFGDGDTSVLANPIHTFTDTGTYTVVLKVTNNCGNVAYHAETITITDNAVPPEHFINAWPSIVCPGENINFQIVELPFFFPVDTADVLWDFGDGNTSTTTNPSYAYDSSGSFTVTLIVYTTCGNDTTIREITVKPGSSPDFTYTLGCAGDTIFFTDASTPAPGTWAWDFGDGDTSTVQNPTHVFASTGTYNVSLTVSDSGCTETITKLIGMNIITSSIEANCGLADGEASVSVTGGIPPYSFLWNDPSSQTTATATAITAGTYMVIVTDSAGCVDSAYAVVNDNTGGSVFISSITNPGCGVCNGNITASVTGGTPPFTYLWNDPASQTIPTATGLCPGTYTIIITDILGCIDSTNLTITEPILSLTTSTLDAGCGANGQASVTASGGTPPYTYLWNDPGLQTNDTAFGLDTGFYTVIVNDNGGCIDSASVTIFLGSGLSLTTSTLDASCSSASGEATVTPFGGTPPYTYLWNDPGSQTNDTATGLTAGFYTVIVNDNGGCVDSASVTIFSSNMLTFTVSPTDLSACGTPDGSIIIIPTSGTAPYTYVWNTGDSTGTITGLDVGVYIVTVIDSNGCSAKDAIGISEPNGPLNASFTSSSDQCFSGNIFIYTRTSGAGGGQSFNWDFGDSVQTSTASDPPPISYSSPGEYIVIMEVKRGACFAYDADIINVFEEPAPVATETNLSCGGGCDGEATVSTTGGIPPYTYLWNDPLFQTDSIATGLCSGSYDVIVSDTNNCTDTASVIISLSSLALSVDSINNISCNGAADGVIYTSVSGGILPLEFKLDTAGAAFQPDSTYSGLSAGSYDLIVRDAILCTDTVFSQIISEPSAITVDSTFVINATCGTNDGSITVFGASGGTGPIEYKIDTVGASFQVDSIFNSLLAGVYSIIVRDSLLCEITVSATINNTTTLFLTVDSVTNVSCPGGSDGVIYTSATGGTPPYEFKIDGGSFQPDSTFTGLPANTYDTIVVRDFSSCIYTISQTISEPSALVISVDSITSVNCNGGADGIIYTSAIGGTPPYEFSNDSGSSYQSDSTFTGLTATNYDIIVRDASLCTDTIFSQIIPEPSILIVSVDSITGVSCNGGSDGIIYLSAAGGTPLYEFSNDNGGSYQSDSTFTGLTATSYDIIVRDALLCTDTLTAIVTEPPPITVTITPANALCNGDSSGVATATVTGGTPGYIYLWTPYGGNDSIADSLIAGVYTLVVFDAAGCFAVGAAVISEPAPLAVSVTPSSDTICEGDSTTLIASGAITYSWSPAASLSSATNDTVEAFPIINTTYMLVGDSAGCMDTVYVDIVINALPVISVTPDPGLICAPGIDSVMLTASGASSYLWQPNFGLSDTTGAIVYASPSTDTTYTVTGTDAFGCANTTTVSVNISTANPAAIFTSDTTGGCGSVTIAFDGSSSTDAVGYSWNFGDSATSTLQNPTHTYISVGAYDVTLIAIGCTTNDTLTMAAYITVNPDPTANITASGFTTFCFGDSVELVSDTTAGNEWLQNGSPVGFDFFYYASASGNYQVVVTNAFGCVDTSAIDTVVVDSLPVISVTPDTGLVCGIGDSVMLTASGAATYTWSPSDSLSATTGAVVYAFPTANSTYSVVGTDLNGCVNSTAVFVQISILAPVANFTSDTTSGGCGSLTVTYNASSSTDAIGYSWDFGDAVISTLQNPIHTYTSAGTYDVTLVAIGCSTNDTTMMVGYITVYPVVTAAVTATDEIVFGDSAGTVQVVVTGGTPPYTYLWLTDSSTVDSIGSLAPGIYTVIVTDSNGCTFTGSDTVKAGPVGINELFVSDHNIKLYPNPTTGVLNIDVDANTKVVSIKVHNIIGNLVIERLIHGGFIPSTRDHYSIDLSGQPQGSYLVSIQTNDLVIVKKINLNK